MGTLIEVGAPDLPGEVTLARVEHDGATRLTLRAAAELRGFATGWFAQPTVFVPLSIAADAPDAEVLGFAYTQFAMPVVAGRALAFNFSPAPNLHSPPPNGCLDPP